jgi:hypothetical protein
MEKMVITFVDGKLPTVEVVSKGIHARKAVSIAALLGTMVAEASLPPIWVEDNLVATNGFDQNIFFIPPHRRDLLIDDLYINAVPIPGLIVALKSASNKVVNVLLFAVTEKRKEDLKISSSLYKMPFPNTYDSGAVCWGDSSVSQYGGMDWQSVLTEFFSSRFNGDLIIKASKAHPDDSREMLIELTGKQEYPVNDLVASASFTSLSELLERGGIR